MRFASNPTRVVPFTTLVMPTISFYINTLRPRRSRRHFADDIFKCIFLNENALTSIQISLKFIPKGPINNMPALVPIMAWRRPGDKPLSEPMIVSLPTHIHSASMSQTVLWHNPVLFPFVGCVCILEIARELGRYTSCHAILFKYFKHMYHIDHFIGLTADGYEQHFQVSKWVSK